MKKRNSTSLKASIVPKTQPNPVYSSQKSLLDLPSELRLMIYKYIISDRPFLHEYTYNKRAGRSRAWQLQFLLACRKVYEEAKGMAYSAILFVFPSIPSYFHLRQEDMSVVARLRSLSHLPSLKSIAFRYCDFPLHNGEHELTDIPELSWFSGSATPNTLL